MMKQLFICTTIFCMCGAIAFAIDPYLQLYDLQVKSINEFMARFNSTEHINIDLQPLIGSTQRGKDILSVCDLEMSRSDPMFNETVKEFIGIVEQENITLDFSDTTWFACAFCDIQYLKKSEEVNILLAPHEVNPRRFTWAIIDVGGKDISYLADTTKWVGISPTDNDLDFIDLTKKSKTNRQHFPGFRKPGKDIDYLSAFVALVQSGVVSINHCKKITYYFLKVPGYVFTVDNILRDSSNSGWLISSLTPIDDSQKLDYLKTMFNY